MENKTITGEGKTTTHIVKGDFGYIISTINDTSDKIAGFHSHTYEGFADTCVDGVVQKVYANIRYEGFAGYTYGARGDLYSPEEHIYQGFIRTANGEFKAVSCYKDKNLPT